MPLLPKWWPLFGCPFLIPSVIATTPIISPLMSASRLISVFRAFISDHAIHFPGGSLPEKPV